jgi:hypothetical protein
MWWRKRFRGAPGRTQGIQPVLAKGGRKNYAIIAVSLPTDLGRKARIQVFQGQGGTDFEIARPRQSGTMRTNIVNLGTVVRFTGVHGDTHVSQETSSAIFHYEPFV